MRNNPSDIEAEAASVVEAFNDAKPEHAPELSWFGMTALQDGDDVGEGFVFDTGEYLDADGWRALREQGRHIEYIETYEQEDGTPSVSIVLPVIGEQVTLGEVAGDE